MASAEASKKTPPAQRSSSPAGLARWPSAVKADYRALRSGGAGDAGHVIKGVLRLSRHGGAAGLALAALLADTSLPARVRMMAGVMYANLNRFDPPTLYRLLTSSQSHVARHAALLLSKLGPAVAKGMVPKAAKVSDPGVAAAIRHHAAGAVTRDVTPRTLELLHTLLTSTDIKKKQWAGTELAVSHVAEADRFLRSLLRDAVADPSTRLQAALALVEGHAKDVKALGELAGRQYPVTLRLAACRQLATLGAKGKAALRFLVGKAPNDPLAAQISALAGR
ncbi:MAG: hypothetical protein KAI47_00935 [Deltaproteobacteria bacterium]|nr:hypothetical protein [Deltaproteobacteria bacterium]